ncbi:S1 family peptidase [Nocardia heshunensis]
MKRFRRLAVSICCAAIASTAAAAGTAAAEPGPAVLGGASGILLNANGVCSLTTIGYDDAARLVGLTAGHCGGAGSPIRAEQNRAAGVVGTVVFSDQGRGLDYAVIEFDPSKVAPVRTVGRTTIAGYGATPTPGASVCTDGRSSGFDCGVVWGPYGARVLNQSCSVPGDSGGPVTLGDQLVGMNQGHLQPGGVNLQCLDAAFPLHAPAYFAPIADILQAINASGGVGTGLRPA